MVCKRKEYGWLFWIYFERDFYLLRNRKLLFLWEIILFLYHYISLSKNTKQTYYINCKIKKLNIERANFSIIILFLTPLQAGLCRYNSNTIKLVYYQSSRFIIISFLSFELNHIQYNLLICFYLKKLIIYFLVVQPL